VRKTAGGARDDPDHGSAHGRAARISAVGSGKIRLRIRELPSPHRKFSQNQPLECIWSSRPTAEIERLLRQSAADRQWNSAA
jgi:hypothetical protein